MRQKAQRRQQRIGRDDPAALAALQRAVDIAGGQVQLARKLEVTYQYVQKMLRDGVPAERVIQIEQAVGGAVTRQELRPDIYPREPSAFARSLTATPAAD